MKRSRNETIGRGVGPPVEGCKGFLARRVAFYDLLIETRRPGIPTSEIELDTL